ncbi:hypothetical protein ACJX0J_036794, partial [Zea mays]
WVYGKQFSVHVQMHRIQNELFLIEMTITSLEMNWAAKNRNDHLYILHFCNGNPLLLTSLTINFTNYCNYLMHFVKIFFTNYCNYLMHFLLMQWWASGAPLLPISLTKSRVDRQTVDHTREYGLYTRLRITFEHYEGTLDNEKDEANDAQFLHAHIYCDSLIDTFSIKVFLRYVIDTVAAYLQDEMTMLPLSADRGFSSIFLF